MNKDFTEIMMINKFMILFCLLLFALTSEGAKDYNNTFILGAGGNTSDTFIYMNSTGEGRFKWDNANNSIQYSNDSGATYTDLKFDTFFTNRVLFGSTTGGFAQDANFYWDNVNKRLGIGINPLTELHVFGTGRFLTGQFGTNQEIVASTSGVELKNNKVISLYELTTNGTNKVDLKAPSDLTTGDYTFTFPDRGDLPTGKMLRTNSGGNSYWGGYNDVRSIEGMALTVSVSAGDLIVDVRARDENSFGGSTSQKPAMLGFRNSNIHSSSTIPNFEIVDDKQITVDNLATLGFYDEQVSWVYVYLINVNNTSAGIKVGISKYPFNDHIPRQYLTSPTTAGNITAVSTSSNSAFYIYSDSALSNTTNYAIKMVGAFKIQKDVSGNLWVNNSAYPVVNGNYESLYKEPVTMKRYVGNGASSISIPSDIGGGTYISLRNIQSGVNDWDTYNIYTPEVGGVTYDAALGRWISAPATPATPANSPHITIPITGYYEIINSYRVRSTNNTDGKEVTEYVDKNQVTQGTPTANAIIPCVSRMDYIPAVPTTKIPVYMNCVTRNIYNAGDLVYISVRAEGGDTSASIDLGGNSGTTHRYISIRLTQELE